MTSFSASDAAISGLRFIRRRPQILLVWSGVIFVYELVYGGLLVGLGGPELSVITTMQEVNRTDPAAAMAMLPRIGFASLVILGGWLAVAAVLFAAAYRTWLEPAAAQRAYLRLGADEFRMAVLIVLWIALGIGYAFLDLFIFGLVGSIGMALPAPLSFPFLGVVFAAGVCAMVYPLMRLSMSMPMTLRDRHLRLLESWKLTRGQFWPIFGACALSVLLFAVLWLALFGIFVLVVAILEVSLGVSPTQSLGLFRADTTSLATFYAPATIVGALLNAVSVAAALMILTAPVAQAYLALSAEPAAPPEPPLAAAGAA